MRVAARLFLSLVPAILGVFTVAGLAYWGRYDRQAPHVLVITAVIASVASLIMTWMNTRYVANKVTKLAEGAAAEGPGDELDRIGSRIESGDERLREYSKLLADATTDAMKQLDEARLPLHILLDNKFGDLNENQEEMLGASRAAGRAGRSASPPPARDRRPRRRSRHAS